MPDNTAHSADPVAREVVQLVLDIRERHLSEAVAVERIRSLEWVISVEQAERITEMSYAAQSAGYPIDAYLYALLALDASDVRWGRTRSSPWWRAADALTAAWAATPQQGGPAVAVAPHRPARRGSTSRAGRIQRGIAPRPSH